MRTASQLLITLNLAGVQAATPLDRRLGASTCRVRYLLHEQGYSTQRDRKKKGPIWAKVMAVRPFLPLRYAVTSTVAKRWVRLPGKTSTLDRLNPEALEAANGYSRGCTSTAVAE